MTAELPNEKPAKGCAEVVEEGAAGKAAGEVDDDVGASEPAGLNAKPANGLGGGAVVTDGENVDEIGLAEAVVGWEEADGEVPKEKLAKDLGALESTTDLPFRCVVIELGKPLLDGGSIVRASVKVEVLPFSCASLIFLLSSLYLASISVNASERSMNGSLSHSR